MRYRVSLVLSLLAAAVVATVAGVPLFAATSTDLVSTYVDAELPIQDPASALWDLATPIDVAMSGQAVTKPMAPQPSVNSVSVRSLNNGRWVAFRVDWPDATKDEGLGYDTFKDGVAVELPLGGGQPFYCMGVAGDGVSILHWRSDFQGDIERGEGPSTVNMNPAALPGYFPFRISEERNFRSAYGAGNPLVKPDRASPVESLVAGGFGTLSDAGRGDGAGWAIWSNGAWSAVLARPMPTAELEDVDLKPGASTSAAFAVWEGSRGDMSGKKTVSSWVTLQLQAPAQVTAEGAGQASPAAAEATAGVPKPAEAVEAGAMSRTAVWVLIGVLATLIVLGTVIVGVGAKATRRRS